MWRTAAAVGRGSGGLADALRRAWTLCRGGGNRGQRADDQADRLQSQQGQEEGRHGRPQRVMIILISPQSWEFFPYISL